MLTVLHYALQRLHYFQDTIVPMEVMDLDNPLFQESFSDESDQAPRQGGSAMLGFGQAELAAEHGPVIHGSRGFTLDDLMRRRMLLLQECRDLRFRMLQEKFQLPVDMQEELVEIKKRLLECRETDPRPLIERTSNELCQIMDSISRMMMLESGDSSRDCMHVGAGRKGDRMICDSGPSTLDASNASIASIASVTGSVDSSRAEKRRATDDAAGATTADTLDAGRPIKRKQGKQIKTGEWTPSPDPEKQHFSFYVLRRMVVEEPPTSPDSDRRACAGLHTRTGSWKKNHFFSQYKRTFPGKTDPEFYWTNRYMPGALGAFWQHALSIRKQLEAELGTDPTPERERRMEALVSTLTGLPAAAYRGLPAVSQVRFLAAPRGAAVPPYSPPARRPHPRPHAGRPVFF